MILHRPKFDKSITSTFFCLAVFIACAGTHHGANGHGLTDTSILIPILQHQDTTRKQPVFMAVEINPEFPGGDLALNQYLSHNIKYPKEAKDKSIQGRVFIQFVVEQDGRLDEMKILRDPGSGLGDEAVRVLSASPKWKPGVQNGKPVRVQYTVPINFTLNDSPKNNPAATPFVKHMMMHVRYPQYARQNNITGVAIASFTVSDDQSIQTVNILKSVSNDIDSEVIRAAKLFKSADKVPAGTYIIACRFTLSEPGKEPVSTDIASKPNYAGEIVIMGNGR